VHQHDRVAVALLPNEAPDPGRLEASPRVPVAGYYVRNVLLHVPSLSWIIVARCYADGVL
jgi:hypothetical protein